MTDGANPVVDRSLASGGTQPADPALDDDTDGARLAAGSTLPPDGGASAAAPSASPDGLDHDTLFVVDRDHYSVGDEFARGGMGRILRARDRRLGRPVAIKVLRHDSDAARARFMREVRITARLQHPAIVNILEAGTLPDGAPFYAMKLVTGEPLDAVIADRRSLADRLGLLPQVIAVVDALAYAHSVRVIHRDLKPSNVLVGAFGETVVIDWGLAKDLAAAGDELDVPADPHPTAVADTEAGAVMGTAAYMPPEQARGEAVDERADVYSLGAMLYHILAGARPYAGKSDVMAAVVSGPPHGLDGRTPGIPADLVAIMHKAMARDPAERYRTAGELADDLKNFQTGQLVAAHQYTLRELLRRWLRRHRTPIAVAAVAVAVLAALGIVSVRRILVERTRTEQQRTKTERSIANAALAAEDMAYLADHELRPVPGTSALREQLVARANALLSELRQVGGLDDDALLTEAANKVRQGDLADEAGQRTEATARYLEASLALRMLSLKAADDTGALRDLSLSLQRLGEVAMASDDFAAARDWLEQALEVRKRLSARDPADPQWRRLLAVTYGTLGDVALRARDLTAAKAWLDQALGVLRALHATEPANHVWQRDLSVTYNKLGKVAMQSNDLAAARAWFEQALDVNRSVTALDALHADWTRDLSVSYELLGDIDRTTGDLIAARANFERSLNLRELLAEREPGHVGWQRDLGVSYQRLGEIAMLSGELPVARVWFEQALEISVKLAARDPLSPDRQSDLALAYSSLGQVELSAGDLPAARHWFKLDEEISASLAARDPRNPSRQEDLLAPRVALGDIAMKAGNVAEAQTWFTGALEVSAALAARDPAKGDWQRNLMIAHQRLGDVALAGGELAEARARNQEALAIAERLVDTDPSNAVWRRDLGWTWSSVGDVASKDRRFADARTSFERSYAIFEDLATREPENPDAQYDLLFGHAKLAGALARVARVAASRPHRAAALAILARFRRDGLYVGDLDLEKLEATLRN